MVMPPWVTAMTLYFNHNSERSSGYFIIFSKPMFESSQPQIIGLSFILDIGYLLYVKYIKLENQ